MTQLYITLSSTQDENKEEIKKTEEEIKKTQEEINGKINETQEDFNRRFDDIVELFKNGGGVIVMVRAQYQGVLKKDEYQFSFNQSPRNDGRDEWYLMPYYGRIEDIVLKTPYDYKYWLDKLRYGEYDTIIRPFLQIEVKKRSGGTRIVKTHLVKAYFCNLFYDKIDGKKPDPLKDEVKKKNYI